MSSSKLHSSPREEALEIALQVRRDILSKEIDPATVLRACLLIAHDLGKKSVSSWIEEELSGYTSKELPTYRVQSCPVYGGFQNNELLGFRNFRIQYPIHLLISHSKKNKGILVDWNEEKEKDHAELIISPEEIDSVLATVIDRCCKFLNEAISALQFGGIVEYLMEEIRRKTDEKLATFDPRITEETQSLYTNLNSTNPADWSKVGHSSRKILKFLADCIFPPSEEKYLGKDGQPYEVTENCYINRLYAFLDRNSSGDERKFMGAQIEYLESYLKQVTKYAQITEHNPSIEKFHANSLAIHTYLVISDIMRYVKEKPS